MMKHDRAMRATGGHQPGHAYMRNMNKSPRGKFHLAHGRAKASRSKSSRG